MAVKMDVNYIGDFQTIVTHGPSQESLTTDLPVDNGGQGRTFSPTDLFATSLGSCILTIMAKVAERDGIEFKGSSISVEKHMADSPRRVAKLIGEVSFADSVPAAARKKLLNCVKACPVHQSLHPDIEVSFVEAN